MTFLPDLKVFSSLYLHERLFDTRLHPRTAHCIPLHSPSILSDREPLSPQQVSEQMFTSMTDARLPRSVSDNNTVSLTLYQSPVLNSQYEFFVAITLRLEGTHLFQPNSCNAVNVWRRIKWDTIHKLCPISQSCQTDRNFFLVLTTLAFGYRCRPN